MTENKYDIIVIGGGHAGIEAALASSRLNNKTLMVVGSKKRISNMPCNPSIGGPAKGIIVREIDALGGQMAKTIDENLLQLKMLNLSKGPAVRALRAQADKVVYPARMRQIAESQKNLEIIEAYVTDILVRDNVIYGIKLENDEEIYAQAVIISSGTYLSSCVLVGHTSKESGPDNERTTTKLSLSLINNGIELIRLKTGTPPRIKTDSIDFSKLAVQPGDKYKWKFSYETKDSNIIPLEKQEVCYLTYTSPKTHQLIKDNIKKSAMFSGLIKGVGPRYCPSIEDKIVRFADKEKHQIFLEPESRFIDETYLQGFSTSMPEELQIEMVRSLPGLENAVIAKYAYAIEYDAINPLQLKANLEIKKISGLFFAGQVNGTSGYEEAACQGLMAGINASLKVNNKEPLVLRRDEAYIGVLIDDLITKGVKDPYRLLTSRAEFRLLLRHDNADTRLTEYGYKVGLISEERYQTYLKKKEDIESLINQTKEIIINPKNEVNQYLKDLNIDVINEKLSGYDFLKRPQVDFTNLEQIAKTNFNFSTEVMDEALIEIKYEGYIKKAYKEAKKQALMEERKIPKNFDYQKIENIAKEAKEKLQKIQPETIGQASRISGVNPSDIAVLLVYLESRRNHE